MSVLLLNSPGESAVQTGPSASLQGDGGTVAFSSLSNSLLVMAVFPFPRPHGHSNKENIIPPQRERLINE